MHTPKYFNRKKFVTLRGNTNDFDTNCTSIQFWNKGEAKCTLYADGTALEIEAGEVVTHSNLPDVLEVTVYERIVFEETGEKKLFVTREFVNDKAPSRNILNM